MTYEAFYGSNDEFAPDDFGNDTPPCDLTAEEEAAIQAQAEANAADPTELEMDDTPYKPEEVRAMIRKLGQEP